MDAEGLTPARVQELLRALAGIDIDTDEAARVLPWVRAAREGLAELAPLDLAEVRSSLGFDPTGPYR